MQSKALLLAMLIGAACKTQDRAVAEMDASSVPSASANASSPAASVASAPPDPAPAVSASAAAPSASASASVAKRPPSAPDASDSKGGGLRLGPSGGPGTSGGLGHCPCGCDHSDDMTSELRAGPRDIALAAIDDSLRTIGEREDAGFVTERMVAHRLRLLALGSELQRKGGPRFTAVPTIHTAAMKTSEALVRAALFLHADSVEIIHGREKSRPASFVLRLDIENTSARDLAFRPPTLEANVALPIRRWYVVGGDGTPWDGSLKARERKLVYAIGYVGASLQPGANVDATIRFESLTLAASVRARRRWDE